MVLNRNLGGLGGILDNLWEPRQLFPVSPSPLAIGTFGHLFSASLSLPIFCFFLPHGLPAFSSAPLSSKPVTPNDSLSLPVYSASASPLPTDNLLSFSLFKFQFSWLDRGPALVQWAGKWADAVLWGQVIHCVLLRRHLLYEFLCGFSKPGDELMRWTDFEEFCMKTPQNSHLWEAEICKI